MLKFSCLNVNSILVFRFAALCITVAMLICNSNPLHAVDLVVYPFNNNTDGNNGFNYSTLDSTLITGASVFKGSGLNMFQVSTDSWSGTTQVLKTGPDSDVLNANETTAFVNNWFFTIKIDPKTAIDIDSISADWSRGGTGASRGWFIRSDIDNFQSNLYLNTTPAGTPTGLAPITVNLNGFKSISNSISFRFYIFTDTQSRFMDFQNIKFTGSASVVPEPGNLVYSVVATAFLIILRYFQRYYQLNRLTNLS